MGGQMIFKYEEGIAEIGFSGIAGAGRDRRKAKISELRNIRLLADTSAAEIYLNDDEEIKEAVQEVFIKLWESRASINENKDIDGLLFIMTRNTIFDYFRKSLNKITMKITALEVAEKIAISDETLEVKDLLEYIWKLVSLLPPRQQEVFIMSRKQQMTNKEIAEQLDISEKAVERNIYFALKFIKKNLNLFIFFITIP